MIDKTWLVSWNWLMTKLKGKGGGIANHSTSTFLDRGRKPKNPDKIHLTVHTDSILSSALNQEP